MLGNRRILTETSTKHFTKEEKRTREFSENQMKNIGLSIDKPPNIIKGCKFGKELYDRCKDTLIENGLLNDNTYNTFGILCYNYHMYIEACETTKKCSKLLNVKKVNTLDLEKLKRLSDLKEQALEEEKIYYKHFRQLCGDFGFTPSTLLKLFDGSPKETKKESVGAMLFGK